MNVLASASLAAGFLGLGGFDMAKIGSITVKITTHYRYWFWSMVSIGWLAVELGADPEKIGSWIFKYGVKVRTEIE